VDAAAVGDAVAGTRAGGRGGARPRGLLAAADALLQALGTGWLRAYVAPVASGDDGLPELRRQLGEAAFQRAGARGAAMGRQRAVAYARQSDDVPAPP